MEHPSRGLSYSKVENLDLRLENGVETLTAKVRGLASCIDIEFDLFRWFFRRRLMHKAAMIRTMRRAAPPREPPSIAPRFEVEGEEPGDKPVG
jgi:hypothetical protein